MADKKRAVVLLSGGLDSATTLAAARAEGYELYALSMDYGQRHRRELESARKLAAFFKVKEHRVLKTALNEMGGSALTDRRIALQTGKTWRPGAKIPSTYVPGRNLIFLALATAYAETLGAEAVFIGANALDYSGYPDCRPGFLKAFEAAARRGTRMGVSGSPLRIEAPLLHLSKARIIALGNSLGVPFELTWSCYSGGKRPCGKCDSCLIRRRGFKQAGLEDPILAKARGEKK